MRGPLKVNHQPDACRLQRANGNQQRYCTDVSHNLHGPIVAGASDTRIYCVSVPLTLTLSHQGRGKNSVPLTLTFSHQGRGKNTVPLTLTLSHQGRGKNLSLLHI